MGQSVRDMLPGYDCPHEAVYLPATTYSVNGMIIRERAICIFEHDSGRPLTRHIGFEEDEFGAVKGYELVIRSISTVGKCAILSLICTTILKPSILAMTTVSAIFSYLRHSD